MQNDFYLKDVFDELVASAQNLRFPDDCPEIRQSWEDALRQHGERLQTSESNFYRQGLLKKVGFIRELGEYLQRGAQTEPAETVCETINSCVSSISNVAKVLRCKEINVKALLNVSYPMQLNRGFQNRIAKSYFCTRQIDHDITNMIPCGLQIPRGITPETKGYFMVVGRHLATSACGIENIDEHGLSFTSNLEEMVSYVRETIGIKKLDIDVTYEEKKASEDRKLLKVCGDTSNLYRVLYNLVKNAWQKGKRTKVNIEASEQSDFSLVVRIADNGPGLQTEEGLFQYGRSFRGGMGLGLFFAKYIIDAHGGQITARAHSQNPEYPGALFEITLPRKEKFEPIIYPC
jgi:hypothetical protein